MDSVSDENAGVVVAAFSRTVSVVTLDMELYGAAVYVNGDYTVDLGPAIWTDATHTKFSYPHVKRKCDSRYQNTYSHCFSWHFKSGGYGRCKHYRCYTSFSNMVLAWENNRRSKRDSFTERIYL